MGLAVLALGGCAAAPESQTAEEWQTTLLEREPLSPAERLEHAQSVLRADRYRRIEQLHQRTLEAAWRVFLFATPQRIWKGTRRLARSVWQFSDRDAAEDTALDWLELARTETGDSQLTQLYDRLHAREREQLSAARVAAAKAAVREGRLDVARILLERALLLDPDSGKALARLADVQKLQRDALPIDSELTVRSWDVEMSQAILAGDYAAALRLDAADPDARFARAAAQLLGGERDAALETFNALAARKDPLGLMAAQWLERPEVDVEGDLARAVHHYRIQRLLGWIGGNTLVERGSGLSITSLRAWRATVTPMNIAVSLPTRIMRGWKPDPRRVREAATHYLELKPRGPSADSARHWLDVVGLPAVDANSFQNVVLPPVRTPFTRVQVAPVIVSRRAVISEYVSASPALRSALEGRNAVWLEARKADDTEGEGFALGRVEARRLLDELAFAVEQSHFRWSLSSKEASLERLRRLDGALNEGYVLFAEPWVPRGSDLWSSLVSTVIDGKDETSSAVLKRGKRDIVAARTLGDEVRHCPWDLLCLDRDGAVKTTLYGYLNVESGGGLGFQSTSGRAGVALGLTQSGPEAALFLPLARWLGIDDWLPLEAEFSFSMQSFYVGPVLRKRQCDDDDDDDTHQILPFGLRGGCVLRMY